MADLPEVSVSPKELIFEGGDASKPIARHLALTNPHNRGESPPGSDASRIPRAGACDRWRPARACTTHSREEGGRTAWLTLLLCRADVCFKVKTTAPRRYYVRPNAARLKANSSDTVEGATTALPVLPQRRLLKGRHAPNPAVSVCAVVLQPQSSLPPPDERKDKFLVQVRG